MKKSYIKNKNMYLELEKFNNMIGGNFGNFLTDGNYKIIGSGGFGKIFKSNKEAIVIKLMYSGKCSDAEKEYNFHKKCYDAFISDSLQTNIPQVHISEPLDFSNEKITVSSVTYDCGYKMSYIENIKTMNNSFQDVLYHIVLKSDYDNLDREVGRSYMRAVDENENPSRGFFATSKYIENNILKKLSDEQKGDIKSLDDVCQKMAYFFSICIFGANLVPIDAEYVLSKHDDKLCVSLLDFGMFKEIDYNSSDESYYKEIAITIVDDICDIDLYFPYTDEPLFKPFLKSFVETSQRLIKKDEKEKSNKDKLLELIKAKMNRYILRLHKSCDIK